MKMFKTGKLILIGWLAKLNDKPGNKIIELILYMYICCLVNDVNIAADQRVSKII